MRRTFYNNKRLQDIAPILFLGAVLVSAVIVIGQSRGQLSLKDDPRTLGLPLVFAALGILFSLKNPFVGGYEVTSGEFLVLNIFGRPEKRIPIDWILSIYSDEGVHLLYDAKTGKPESLKLSVQCERPSELLSLLVAARMGQAAKADVLNPVDAAQLPRVASDLALDGEAMVFRRGKEFRRIHFRDIVLCFEFSEQLTVFGGGRATVVVTPFDGYDYRTGLFGGMGYQRRDEAISGRLYGGKVRIDFANEAQARRAVVL